MKSHTLKIISVGVALCFNAGVSISQTKPDCLGEVRAIEEKTNFRKDTTVKDKNIYISYTVRVTDWENGVTVSNIKMYTHMQYMHFFTEQANIYRDGKEVVMILPIQKIAIINSTNSALNDTKISEGFFEMRKGFLDSCEVVRCEKVSGRKILELKVVKDNISSIESITYEYDAEQAKMISTRVNYNENYKIKQMLITYKDFSLNSDHKYSASRTYLMEKNGHLLPKLSGYEFMDNRDLKKKYK